MGRLHSWRVRDCEKGLSVVQPGYLALEYSLTSDSSVSKNQCQFSAIIASYCLPFPFSTIKGRQELAQILQNVIFFLFIHSSFLCLDKGKQTKWWLLFRAETWTFLLICSFIVAWSTCHSWLFKMIGKPVVTFQRLKYKNYGCRLEFIISFLPWTSYDFGTVANCRGKLLGLTYKL